MYNLPSHINVQTLGVICGTIYKQKKVFLIKFVSALRRMCLYSFKLKIYEYFSICVTLAQILRTHLLYKRCIVVKRTNVTYPVAGYRGLGGNLENGGFDEGKRKGPLSMTDG
jgi:hypothetical protein